MSDVGQPQPFPTRTLAQIASQITDGSHFSPTPQKQGHLIANVKDMKSGRIDFDGCTRISTLAFRELKATGCVIKKGNVLLSKDGTVGRVVVYESEQEIGALSSICLITPQAGQDPRFLGHALQSHECVRQYENSMSGSALRRLVLRDIRQIRVPTPAVDEQATVAEVLDTLDTTIRQTEAIIEKLKQVKQGLLHDLLTRGIDANGELRPPQSQAPHLYKDSPLGWIPRDWNFHHLSDVSAVITSGSRGWAAYYVEVGDLFVRSQNVRMGRLDLSDRQHVRPPNGGEGQRTRVESLDLLITITGNGVGNLAHVPEQWEEVAFVSQHVGLVRFYEPQLAKFAVQFFVEGAPGNQQLIYAQYGQSKPGLSLENLRNLCIPLPPMKERISITERLNCASDHIQLEDDFACVMRELKQGLMDDLLTGRVRVTPLIRESIER